MFLDRRVRPASGIRNRGILDEQVEPAELGADAFGGSSYRGVVSHVELYGCRAGADPGGGGLSLREIARADEDGDAVRNEFFGDLQADTLVGAGYEGNARMRHNRFLRSIACHGTCACPILAKAEPCSALNTEHCSALQEAIWWV